MAAKWSQFKLNTKGQRLQGQEDQGPPILLIIVAIGKKNKTTLKKYLCLLWSKGLQKQKFCICNANRLSILNCTFFSLFLMDPITKIDLICFLNSTGRQNKNFYIRYFVHEFSYLVNWKWVLKSSKTISLAKYRSSLT